MIELIIFSLIFIFLINHILITLFKIKSIQSKIILILIVSFCIFYYLSKNENRLLLIQINFVKYIVALFIIFALYKLALHLYSNGFNHITSLLYIGLMFFVIIIFLNIYFFNTEFDKLYRNLYKRLNNKI